MDSVGLYVDEAGETSWGLLFVLGLAFVTVWPLESWRQTSSVPALKVGAYHAAFLVLAFFVLHAALYLIGWQHRWLGEVPTMVLALAVATVTLFAAKRAMHRRAGLTFLAPNRMAFVPLLFVMLPVVLFLGFVTLLGSAWTN